MEMFMFRLLSATATAFVLSLGVASAGQPENPGRDGQTKSFGTKGFERSVTATGQDLTDRAADVFGNNGKGNGADPDPLGLADDHDPNNFGGAPDTDR
jgi:hypothetical protein